jgi:hypothetical protein
MRAISLTDGKPFLLSIPAGSIVTVNVEPPKQAQMVLVSWEDKTIKIFKVDLLRLGDPVRGSAAKNSGK